MSLLEKVVDRLKQKQLSLERSQQTDHPILNETTNLSVLELKPNWDLKLPGSKESLASKDKSDLKVRKGRPPLKKSGVKFGLRTSENKENSNLETHDDKSILKGRRGRPPLKNLRNKSGLTTPENNSNDGKEAKTTVPNDLPEKPLVLRYKNGKPIRPTPTGRPLGPIIKCINCERLMHQKAKGMCGTCYDKRPRPKGIIKAREHVTKLRKECVECKRKEIVVERGMCKKCYKQKFHQKIRAEKFQNCAECGKYKYIVGRGMCPCCYTRKRKEAGNANVEKHRACLNCDQVRWIHGQGRCTTCYERRRKKLSKQDLTRHKECKACGCVKFIKCHEVCEQVTSYL